MQSGGFQHHPLMRMTLALTLLFLVGFVITNFALYFAKMDLTPHSVVTYYSGSEADFQPARSYQSMLEVTHGHLAMMALVVLMLTHLLIFAPFSRRAKVMFIVVSFGSALLDEASGWLVRFVAPQFGLLKVLSFLTLQASLIFLLGALALHLFRGAAHAKELQRVMLPEETEAELTEEEAQLP